MSKRMKLFAVAGLTALSLVILFGSAALAQGPGYPYGRGMMGRGIGGYGMMGRQGAITSTLPFGPSGMMGRGIGGYGMMGRQGITGTLPCPMIGGSPSAGNVQPVTAEEARKAAVAYIGTIGDANLAISEMMEFGNNFYVSVVDKTTGNGAFELLVDRYGGYVYPEPGPNMMWNTRYGHMGALQGQAGPMTVGVEQARAAAQKFLDGSFPGARLAADTQQFPGYYTLDYRQNGKTAGMLSVNGYTGQVWYHTWHGRWVAETQSGIEM